MQKLEKQLSCQIAGLLLQGDLSLVRFLSSGATQEFKEFYNRNRLRKIEQLLERIDYFEIEKLSTIDAIRTSFLEKENVSVSDTWLYESLGALHTLVFYINNLDTVPNEAMGFLRWQFCRLSSTAKTKVESAEIIYFNRHDLNSEQYYGDYYLWANEIEQKI